VEYQQWGTLKDIIFTDVGNAVALSYCTRAAL